MIIIGENLKSLNAQYRIVEESCYDDFSFSLGLSRSIRRIVNNDPSIILDYGSRIPDGIFKEEEIPNSGLVLAPQECILACSDEIVSIPNGFFGLLQTKGSLARMFVMIHCSDAQIEPGFDDRITFEICNLSPFSIRLMHGQKVAQLFILKSSTRIDKEFLYHGRYQGSQKPTIQIPPKGK